MQALCQFLDDDDDAEHEHDAERLIGPEDVQRHRVEDEQERDGRQSATMTSGTDDTRSLTRSADRLLRAAHERLQRNRPLSEHVLLAVDADAEEEQHGRGRRIGATRRRTRRADRLAREVAHDERQRRDERDGRDVVKMAGTNVYVVSDTDTVTVTNVSSLNERANIAPTNVDARNRTPSGTTASTATNSPLARCSRTVAPR